MLLLTQMGGGGGTSSIRNLAVEGSGWSELRSGRSTLSKDPVSVVQVVGWTSGLVWPGTENLTPNEILSPHPRALVIYCTDFATPSTEALFCSLIHDGVVFRNKD